VVVGFVGASPFEYRVSLYSLMGVVFCSSLNSGSFCCSSDGSFSFLVCVVVVGGSSFVLDRWNNFNFTKAMPSFRFFLEWLCFLLLIRFSLKHF
jgi:hypothetical protein